MKPLAWKNLLHDKVRLAVTLTGIVFALVLIIVQFGLFLGFLDTSANVVVNSGADLWITARNLPHVNAGKSFPEDKLYRIRGIPGVQRAEKQIVNFVNWQLPQGGAESVQVTGFALHGGMGGPWHVTAGTLADLEAEDTVFIDELYRDKLGITHLGQTAEITGHRARVVGYTRGIRSFTTAPYVFTSYKNAQNYAQLARGETFFILVKATPGTDVADLRDRLAALLPQTDVFTAADFAFKTQFYWLFKTGAGITTLIGAFLGLIVGVVVVAQTIYAATMDHLREFGTLKAMGAANSYLYAVILQQAALSAVGGYVLAVGIGYAVVRGSASGEAAILMPWQMALGMLLLALGMCFTAAMLSIRKATTIDPAMVFRG